MDLGDAFKLQRDVGTDISTVVLEALRPFKPQSVNAYIDEQFVYRKLYIEAIFQGLTLDMTLRVDDFAMLRYPQDVYSEMYRQIYQHFRNRPGIEPDDHIVLGAD